MNQNKIYSSHLYIIRVNKIAKKVDKIIAFLNPIIIYENKIRIGKNI
jgi:hypothetical protein